MKKDQSANEDSDVPSAGMTGLPIDGPGAVRPPLRECPGCES